MSGPCPGHVLGWLVYPGHVAATNRAAILRQSRAKSSLNPTVPRATPPVGAVLAFFVFCAFLAKSLGGRLSFWLSIYGRCNIFANIRGISCGDNTDRNAINSQVFAGIGVCVSFCVCVGVCVCVDVWGEVSFN